MITDIAQRYAELISRKPDHFIIGFVDAWHGEPQTRLREDNLLHDDNIAYNIGYSLGTSHRATWQNMELLLEDDED